jgi:hypothetical protein
LFYTLTVRKLVREETRTLQALVRDILQNKQTREAALLVIMRDENLIGHLLNSNDAADVVQMVAGHVIVEARGFLDLLSGMIALRTSPSPPS